ncbi:hypothetical protein [Streptomyces sp. NPDC086023]|uniref:hypothetical protein n=1 Tax=Streptomyces sp. NPDC086023 TaxID=3365746 RepID=UPI0037D26C87
MEAMEFERARWIGGNKVPAGKPTDFKHGRDLVCSDWNPIFAEWVEGQIESGNPGFAPGLTVDINWLISYRRLFDELCAGKPEGEDKEFVRMYSAADDRVSALIEDFAKFCKRNYTDISPARRMADQGDRVWEQLSFHKESHLIAKAYVVQYLQLADQLGKVPQEVLDHVVQKKTLRDRLGGGDSTQPDDGISLKSAELKHFRNLVPIADALRKISLEQGRLLDGLYRAEEGGLRVWQLHKEADLKSAGKVLPEQYEKLIKVHMPKLPDWYDLMQGSMNVFVAQADALAKDYDKELKKIATKQVVKVLGKVNPTYAGAALALHGAAAATGVTAATVSPIIGPFSMLVGLGAAALEKGAAKVEKKGAKQALKDRDAWIDTGVTMKIKRVDPIKNAFKATKIGAAATNKAEGLLTQAEQWHMAATMTQGAQAVGPIGQVLGEASLPLAAISGVAGMANSIYGAAVDFTTEEKFPDHVKRRVADLARSSGEKRKSTRVDQLKRAKAAVDSGASVLASVRAGLDKQINPEARFRRGEILFVTDLRALVAREAWPECVGRKGDHFVFASHDVQCNEGGGSLGKYTTDGIVKRMVWTCTVEGRFVQIEGVEDNWRAPKNFELSPRRSMLIYNAGDDFRKIVAKAYQLELVARDPNFPRYFSRVDWTSDHYAKGVDEACRQWADMQQALDAQFLKIATEKKIELTDQTHQQWPALCDLVGAWSDATTTRGSGVEYVRTAKADAPELVKLQVAFWNRANGQKDLDCNDTFWFEG